MLRTRLHDGDHRTEPSMRLSLLLVLLRQVQDLHQDCPRLQMSLAIRSVAYSMSNITSCHEAVYSMSNIMSMPTGRLLRSNVTQLPLGRLFYVLYNVYASHVPKSYVTSMPRLSLFYVLYNVYASRLSFLCLI